MTGYVHNYRARLTAREVGIRNITSLENTLPALCGATSSLPMGIFLRDYGTRSMIQVACQAASASKVHFNN